MKRFLAMLLAVMLVIGLLPMGVLAAENEGVSPASDEEATPTYTLTATAGANGTVSETKFIQDTDDGSLYYVYVKPEAGYKLTGYTVGGSTTTLTDTDKTCSEVTTEGTTQELVYFQYKASADTNMTLNFAEGVEKSSYFTLVAPSDVTLTLTNTEKNQTVEPKITETNATLGKTVYKFDKQGTKSCVFRLSGANYITYTGSAFVNAGESKVITKENLQLAGKTATTLDRDTSSHGGVNVANLYMNVNAAGHLKLEQGKTFQINLLRDWIMTNITWDLTRDYKFISPDYHYTVLDMDGKASNDIITVDENGLITAKAAGDAIVLVSYDAIIMDYADKDMVTSDSYKPNGFWSALWPENTGVFVVSVGAEESGIKTGATINQPKPQDKNVGITSEEVTRAIDSEYDVIYFVGDKGEYTFTPKTAGVTVSVANSKITDKTKAGTMTFEGFTTLTAAEDGSYTVPLVEGKNIIKVAKDGKAEYQVITAKAVEVTVNGMSLDKAGVAPGEEVKVQFSQIYNPYNRSMYVNSDTGLLYRNVSGYTNKYAGTACGPYGNYLVASLGSKRTISKFAIATYEDETYKNPVLRTTDEKLKVPADYTDDYFTLSDGSFNIVGFGDGLEEFRKGNATNNGEGDEGEVKLSNAIYRWLGELPEIKIPVVKPQTLEVTTQPSKTTYKLNEEFSTDGMVVKVTYTNGASREITDYTCSKLDSSSDGEKTVTVSYTAGGETVSTTVTVTVSSVTVTSIEVTKQPTKTVYKIGDKFAPAGMVVTAHYSDGNSKELESGEYTYDTTPFDNTKAKVNVEIKAAGLTTTVEVTINMVVKLERDSDTFSTEYTVGEKCGKVNVIRTFSTGQVTTASPSSTTTMFASSPIQRALTAYDNKIVITTRRVPQIASMTNLLGIADLEPLVVPFTVTDNTGNSANAITVNMTCVVEGDYATGKTGTQLYNVPVSVYDLDNDGKISMMDAFVALHYFQYKDGACGYDENDTGVVWQFWGINSKPTTAYELNGTAVTKAKTQEIKANDNIVAYVSTNANSVTASFAEATATAKAGERTAFTVGAKSGETDVIPSGATVTVYDSEGKKVENLSTTVYTDGGFALRFPSAGTYTIVVGGECTYTSNDKSVTAVVRPARCTVTVTGSAGGTTTPENKTIDVYVSYANEGKLVKAEGKVLYKIPVTVSDYDGDGSYTMGEAFRAFHEEYCPSGTNGLIYDTDTGWLTKFWGIGSMNVGYTHNHKWVFGLNEKIKAGSELNFFFYQDESSWSDLLTWFAKDNYTGKTGSDITFTVRGMSVFASEETNKQVLAAPEGATVTITDPSGAKSTTETDEDGKFTLSFPDAGTYTLDVGGTCSYTISGTTNSDAPVVPSRCTVAISGTSTGGSIGGATAGSNESIEDTVTTVNPSATANKNGEATANVGSGTMKDAISDAKNDGSSAIVIEPEVKGDASKVTVNVPVSSAASVGKDAGADLTVKTAVGTITLPAEELKNLSGSGNLTISAEAKDGGTVEVNITKGGEDVEMKNISVTVPAKNGKTNTVLVVVHEDGTEEVLKKSVATENGVTGLVDGSCTVKAVEKTADFGDTENHWAKDAAEFVANREIFKGTGEKAFSPDLSMSRAMVATVLHRLESTPKTNGKTNYTDTLDVWAEDGIAWATENEIVTGYAGIFDGNRPVTRQELATMLYRYAKVVGLNTDSKGDLSKFTDGSATADWAKEAMIWAVQNGLLTGKPNNTLDPAGTASRAEVAAVIQRLIGLMVK